jgi:hypothetical protein
VSMEDLGMLLRRHKTIRHVNTDDPELVQYLSPSDTLEELVIEESSIGMISVLIKVVPNMTKLWKLRFGGRRDGHLKNDPMKSLRCCPKLETVECSSCNGPGQFFDENDDKCRLEAWAQRNRLVGQWLSAAENGTAADDGGDYAGNEEERSSLPKCLWPQFLEMIRGVTTEKDIIFQLLSKPSSPLLGHLIQSNEYDDKNSNNDNNHTNSSSDIVDDGIGLEEPSPKRPRILS